MSIQLFDDLIGLTMSEVKTNNYSDELYFVSTDGKQFMFHHEQDCCERVYIEDIIGDLTDLMGTPIIKAEEISNDQPDDEYSTWAFYRFLTTKGTVTVRWFGISNCYSTSVSFTKL